MWLRLPPSSCPQGRRLVNTGLTLTAACSRCKQRVGPNSILLPALAPQQHVGQLVLGPELLGPYSAQRPNGIR